MNDEKVDLDTLIKEAAKELAEKENKKEGD